MKAWDAELTQRVLESAREAGAALVGCAEMADWAESSQRALVHQEGANLRVGSNDTDVRRLTSAVLAGVPSSDTCRK